MAFAYPFIPKSTSRLERGQFWAIPLADGSFGAGCVVRRHYARDQYPKGKASSRTFIAGVVAWHGDTQPTAQALDGCALFRHAFAHIKVITSSGGQILGQAALAFSGAPEAASALSMSTWGFNVPTILAQAFAGVGS